ncbi:MAG: phosphopantetheine adenylyltransferase [Candidatus Bathyarchaeia archaeon]
MTYHTHRDERRLFKVVGVGGTFDELHMGHKILLIKAFEYSEKVLIGLSTDELSRRLGKTHEVAPYDIRLRNLLRFLEDLGVSDRARIMPLDDPYGPTLLSSEIEAIIVSKETEAKAREINALREKKGLKPLEIIAIDMVLAEDNIPISTTRIKRGEIDHDGRLTKRGNI